MSDLSFEFYTLFKIFLIVSKGSLKKYFMEIKRKVIATRVSALSNFLTFLPV